MEPKTLGKPFTTHKDANGHWFVTLHPDSPSPTRIGPYKLKRMAATAARHLLSQEAGQARKYEHST